MRRYEHRSYKSCGVERGAERDDFRSKMDPKLTKIAPKGNPTGPKLEPKGRQNGARTSQDAPKWSLGAKVSIFNGFWSNCRAPLLIKNNLKTMSKNTSKNKLTKIQVDKNTNCSSLWVQKL